MYDWVKLSTTLRLNSSTKSNLWKGTPTCLATSPASRMASLLQQRLLGQITMEMPTPT